MTEQYTDAEVNYEEMPMAAVIATTDLGPNNKGTCGPDSIDDDLRTTLDAKIGNPEYHRIAYVRRWHCVDGRVKADTETIPEGEYPAQIAGSVPVSETAAEFMTNPTPNALSITVAAKTDEAIADGIEPYVHGDSHHGKEGCGANKKMRDTLRSNAENVDIVVPRAMALAEAVGLTSKGVTSDMAVELVVAGGAIAENDEIWDVTPEQVIDIMVEHGATYEELEGSHSEQRVVVDTTDHGTFDGTKFAEDHTHENGEDEVFVATLGAYVKQKFERNQARGIDDYETAKQCLAVILFNVGVPKEIGNDNLEVAILGKA